MFIDFDVRIIEKVYYNNLIVVIICFKIHSYQFMQLHIFSFCPKWFGLVQFKCTKLNFQIVLFKYKIKVVRVSILVGNRVNEI